MNYSLLNRSFLGRTLTVLLFITLSVAGMVFSVYLFSIARSPYMYILAVSFMGLSLIAGFFNVYASIWYFRSYFYDGYIKEVVSGFRKSSAKPTVAVVVPVYNEDPEMVERNIAKLRELDYPKSRMHFYLADDSTDERMAASLESVSKKHGFEYIHRDNRTGFKAGALNNALSASKEEFVAVFDADEYLTDKNFITDLLPFFQNKKIAYVQTEKRYAKHSFFSDSVDVFDAFFFKFIQPARSLNNTAIFAGSCGLIRRSALEKIGGFPEYVIEDTFFSFESDMHDFKSLHYPKVYAIGRPIKTFSELVKQQWRYNYGDTQFISYFFRRKGYRKGSPLSNIDYITHGFGLNYLSVVLIMFTIVSIGVVFAALPFAHFNFQNISANFLSANKIAIYLEILGFFAFTLSLLTPVLLTKIYFKSFKKGFMIFLLNYALAFVRTKAAVATFLKGANPGIHWNRNGVKTVKNNFPYAVANTRTEISFAAVMFGLGAFSLLQSNISGGVWLLWYGVLYSLSTVMLYKYG
ncbi:MAG: glycosyltransferase [Candidatus Micrarchaeota archaeon]|nr:glycosyltransferase [Candidatus Micrarchaeota archaeon]MDE1804436.1 glycosyltransferase [Candidatus Micrarchaeota archaeon]MDE1847109.1 glycosyltransferase [Candidatus Micrarchaeota archaeon]